VIVSKDIHI